MSTATYYEDHELLFVRCSEHIDVASWAEWIISIGARHERLVLVDLRAMHTIDRPADGAHEYVNLQSKLNPDYAPARKMALLAPGPLTFVQARVFEQIAQDSITTEIEVFREAAEALAFLGVCADDVDTFIASLGEGRRLG
ncbi:hypothetical protein [uncultured Aliiroseovarius sp.]|uniref:hypothetical protein n=1 Tax=uncultured Aliiroseovarius sp. TaxID=1658783 RepID=UPI0025918FE5|nr:hypothetical protein [uncultured Aliiroseovarius sp.]